MQEIGGCGLTIAFVHAHMVVWFNWPLFRGRYALALVNLGLDLRPLSGVAREVSFPRRLQIKGTNIMASSIRGIAFGHCLEVDHFLESPLLQNSLYQERMIEKKGEEEERESPTR